MKVLITDDSEFMRVIIKTSLKDIPGIEFLEAENGDVAVELYREYHPDLVFLDIIMPVKNGVMAMEEIKQLNPNAKIVIVTSVGQNEMVDKAKDLKADGFIPKPFRPDQIQQIFHQLFP
jgi:two-component system chemotaxis response regulator CheY